MPSSMWTNGFRMYQSTFKANTMNSYSALWYAFSLAVLSSLLQLLQQLSQLAIKLPDSCEVILKEAGRIRRPFQAQAFALVMLCRFLSDHFTNIESNASITVDKVIYLEE